jgi:hypothetical protein
MISAPRLSPGGTPTTTWQLPTVEIGQPALGHQITSEFLNQLLAPTHRREGSGSGTTPISRR